MKYVLFAVILAITGSIAFAKDQGNPQPGPPDYSNTGYMSTYSEGGTSRADSASRSAAGADAKAKIGDISYDSSSVDKSQFFSFAPGAWTKVPSPVGCLGVESTATNVLFGAGSHSNSKLVSEKVCIYMLASVRAYNNCEYAIAWDLREAGLRANDKDWPRDRQRPAGLTDKLPGECH